jgi:hypothetical protein
VPDVGENGRADEIAAIADPLAAFSELHADRYMVYRLFEFEIESREGKLFRIEGDVRNACTLEPTSFPMKI